MLSKRTELIANIVANTLAVPILCGIAVVTYVLLMAVFYYGVK